MALRARPPLLVVTLYCTAPEPLPEVPEVMVAQLSPEDAVQVQPEGRFTVTVPEPPPTSKEAEVALKDGAQFGLCSWMDAVPDFELSAWPVARTTTDCEEAMTAGAV